MLDLFLIMLHYVKVSEKCKSVFPILPYYCILNCKIAQKPPISLPKTEQPLLDRARPSDTRVNSITAAGHQQTQVA